MAAISKQRKLISTQKPVCKIVLKSTKPFGCYHGHKGSSVLSERVLFASLAPTITEHYFPGVNVCFGIKCRLGFGGLTRSLDTGRKLVER